MARISECPRCGAGVGHNETQCWRCGEAISGQGKAKITSISMGKPQGPGIKDMRASPTKEIPRAEPSVRPIAVSYNGRERELEDREKEVREAMAALEAESKEMEAAALEMEKERQALAETRKRLSGREEELDAKAILLEDILAVAEELRESMPAEGEGRERFEDLTAAQTELRTILDDERERIRREIERDMAEQLTRIGQLEAELKVAHALVRKEGAPPVPVDVRQVLAEVSSELNAQIGAGLEGRESPAVRTHVERLDQILSGGIPQGGVTLVNGPPGSMKTSLTYHILHNAASKGSKKGLFLSLEQDSASLLRQMARLGMDRDGSLDRLMVVDLVDLRRSMEGHEGDWRSIVMRYIEETVAANGIDLLALDSLESLAAMCEHELARTEVQDIFDSFRSMGLTTLVISETPMNRLEGGGGMELYVADGAFELTMRETEDSHVQRWLRCVKMRGANIDTRPYCMMHAGGSFILNVPLSRSCVQ
ncbi:MAG: AAA family ATPase [Methanomassiliicoccus sp.]|nr:AAA family ATPase [Methanomassiliicoccus sp.]